MQEMDPWDFKSDILLRYLEKLQSESFQQVLERRNQSASFQWQKQEVNTASFAYQPQKEMKKQLQAFK